MALKIGVLEGERVRVSQKLWLTADREKLVPDGDPASAFLFCVAGGHISVADAKRYGLVVKLDDDGETTAERVADETPADLDGEASADGEAKAEKPKRQSK